jgi:3-oxoacyl-[acyl-carrier protein] reductase
MGKNGTSVWYAWCMRRFDSTCVLVTGGSRGIGAAVARRLAAEGATVTVTYLSNAAGARSVVAELTDAGHTAFALQGDVRDRAATQAVVAEAAEHMGGLDVVISNAGVEYFGPLASITEQDFRRVFDTNVAGQLFVVQAAVPLMTHGGRIVLMSSVSAGIAVFEHSLYAASKAAVRALAQNLAPELAARNITINAIAPGGTRTDMAAEHAPHYTHPLLRGVDLPGGTAIALHSALGRLADPDEVAAAIAFLASPDAAYVSGSTMPVDGAWT